MLQTSRFSFLRKELPVLYDRCVQAENMQDVESALVKARKVLEYLVREMGVYSSNLFGGINALQEEGRLNSHIRTLFHDVRMRANKGAHDGDDVKPGIDDKEFVIDRVVEICIWYAVKEKNLHFILEDFATEDLSKAKKFLGCEETDTDTAYYNPTAGTKSIDHSYEEEVDPLQKNPFETMDEYAERIADMGMLHMGYAILDTREAYGANKVQFPKFHIDVNASAELVKDDVCFYVENVSGNAIDGKLKARLMVCNGRLCCDYSSFVLYTDEIELPLKFVCWHKLQTESREQFEARIAGLPYLPVAVCTPKEMEYNIAKELLPFAVGPMPYANAIKMEKRLGVFCSVDKAKLLCQKNKQGYYAMAKLSADLQLADYIIWNEAMGNAYDSKAERENKISGLMEQAEHTEDQAAQFALYEKAAELGDARAQWELGCCYYYGNGVENDYAEAAKWFIKAAEQNYAEAQGILGFCYESGLGVEQDIHKAVEWYTKAAEQGDVKGQFVLGLCYEDGKGVEQDYEKAAEWYTKAAEQDNAVAQCNLGILYEDGKGVEQSYEKAVEWYAKAAEQEHGEAQNRLGCCYLYGICVEQDYQKAMEWFSKGAANGNSWAQCHIGSMYANGAGVEQDYKTAVEWFIKAAEQNNANAQNAMGYCYLNGYGVEQDYKTAVEWYLKAAEQGHSMAQCSLGNFYYKGKGVAKDFEQAVKWYTKAAEQGNAEAQNSLGVCYFNGYGVAKSLTEGFEWYRKAAEQGDASAQTNMAYCYLNGRGVAQDYARAVEWYTKAAENGEVNAQVSLGDFYYEGGIVKRDRKRAREWYGKAAEQGHPYAKERYKQMSGVMGRLSSLFK